MPDSSPTARQTLDGYFLETRAKLIEIAANLDRLDRTPDAGSIAADPRLTFIREALAILSSSQPEKARRMLELYSLK